MRSTTGLFVVFEGGDAVGKSTQVQRLVADLAAEAYDVIATFEPGDGAAGQQIRHILLNPATGDLAPRAEALLYAADKAHHVQTVVAPALDRGAIVVSDRYVDSMLAYQGAGRVLNHDEVECIARWATQDLRPHLTVVLDADPGAVMAAKAELDRLESAGEDLHLSARAYFLALAARDPEHYLVLDARQDRDTIAAAVRARLIPLLAALG